MTTLVATYLNPDDTACTGTITFELSAAVYDSDPPAIRPQARLTETLDNTGSISVDLMPYDDPGLSLVGTLTYRVTERIDDAPVRRYFVAVPLDANPVDLGTLAPQGTPGAVTTAALLPAGGDDGQVLAKASDDDYDTEWVDQTGGGGTTVAGFPAATYTWKAASQSTDPGTGCIGVNNNDPGSATIMRVSATDGDSNDLHYGWQLLREGDSVSVVSDADDTKGYRWYVDGTITDNSTWLSIPIGLAVALAGGEPTGDTDVKVLVYPTGGEVTSVNGDTGAVVLDPDDLDDTGTTHKFTTAGDISKLAGIEASADVTDATNVAAAGALMATLADAKGDLLVASAADTVTRLAVGTNDYVLTADSAAATGVKWAAATGGTSITALPPPPMVVGYYHPATAYEPAVFATLTKPYLYAMPLPVASSVTLDRIGVMVSGTVSGASVRLGIYEATAGGKPGDLVLDAGTVDCSTAGFKAITISQTLTRGLYFVACVSQGSANPSVCHTGAENGYALWPYQHYIPADDPPDGTKLNQSWWVGSVTGALPDPFGTPGGIGGNNSGYYVPVRVSA